MQVSTANNSRIVTPAKNFNSTDMWEQFQEGVPNFDDTSIKADSLLEHMNTTKDKSDYLWYTIR